MSATFGQTMRDLRETSGISLRTLGKVLELSASYISDMERGTRHPPGDEAVVAAWGHALGAEDVDALLVLAAQGRPRPCHDCYLKRR